MEVITSSQFNILKTEIKENINLKEKLNALLEDVRNQVEFELYDQKKALSKIPSASEADVALYKDLKVLENAPWTSAYISLITLDILKEISTTLGGEFANNIMEASYK